MTQLSHIIYTSAAAEPISERSLVQLLHRSRNSNSSQGITGMLLYNAGSFFQVLEGPTSIVEGLAAKIAKDTRHVQMTIIINEPIHKRSFGEWTMGFGHVVTAELAEIAGFNDFFDGQRILADIDIGRAQKLLLAFRNGRWRVRIGNHQPTFTVSDERAPTPQQRAFSSTAP